MGNLTEEARITIRQISCIQELIGNVQANGIPQDIVKKVVTSKLRRTYVYEPISVQYTRTQLPGKQIAHYRWLNQYVEWDFHSLFEATIEMGLLCVCVCLSDHSFVDGNL